MAATDSTSRRGTMRNDRWANWPVVTTLSISLVVAVLCGIPGDFSFVLILLAAFGAPVAGVVLVILAAVLVVRRRPRMATSILVAAVLPALLWQPILWASDYVHLGLTVLAENGQPGSRSSPDAGSFAAYDWSVGLAGGPNTFLLYDTTDEIVLPPKLHKQPIAAENGFGEDCAGKVRHLLGHYYVCTF